MSADNYTACPRCQGDGKGAQTFREDWEIGVFGGEFYVNYEGFCRECKLSYKFKFEDVVRWTTDS